MGIGGVFSEAPTGEVHRIATFVRSPLLKKCSKCQEAKELSEFHTGSQGLYPSCKVCKRLVQAMYYKNNKEKAQEKMKQYRDKNREELKAKSRAAYEADPEKFKLLTRQARIKDPEKAKRRERAYHHNNKEKRKALSKQYRQKNSDRVRANNAARRAEQIRRTPKWLTKGDLEFMRMIYQLAKGMEIATGIKHHVDHIYPLLGDFVSGLHVPDNLQILTAAENISKHNKWVPE